MESFERLHATSWEEAKDFVDTGYVSMSQEMNAVTQSVEIEQERGFDILEILNDKSKNKDAKIHLLQEYKELNMDETQFSPEKYLALIHDETSFNKLVNGPLRLETKIHHKNKEIMDLVESHFDQFINCKDTLDKMQLVINNMKVESAKNGLYLDVVIKMQEKYNELLKSLASVKRLTDLKTRVDQSREAISVIERARSVFSLPAQLRNAAANRDDDRFVSVFNRAQGLSKETEIGIYQDVLKDCNIIAQRFVDELFEKISKLDLTRNAYDRCLTTLFEMKQFPAIVLKEGPVIFLLRSHREALRKLYEEAYDELIKKEEVSNERTTYQSILSASASPSTKNDSTKVVTNSKKYVAIHKICSKMIDHISKLLGVVQFSGVKKSNEAEEETAELRKTTVLFEDGTIVPVSYSKNTTITMFLDLALTTYKLTHPDLPFETEFELCSFVGRTNEKDSKVLGKSISEAIVLGESDMPYELETRWTTAAKDLSHAFYARIKRGVVEKESTLDRSTYVVKIVQDFCENVTKMFNYEENVDVDSLILNNLIDKACLEDIESVLVAFTAQQVENKYNDPLKKTHSELVTAFIERITAQTRKRIIHMKDYDEIFINPGNGILVAFQKLYAEDFKMLKEIIQATENPDEQVIKYFGIAVDALKEFFKVATKECNEALIAEKGRDNQSFGETGVVMNEYRQLTKQRKLLSLAENAHNAFNGQMLWDLYNFSSSTNKEVVGENVKIKELLKEFDEQSVEIMKYYVDDEAQFFSDMLNKIDAKWYDVWINEDIDYKMVDEYALNLITELVIIKQDLHIYAMTKESTCMAQIIVNLIRTFEEVANKTCIVEEDQEQDANVYRVGLRWLIGAEFIIEACKHLVEKDAAIMSEIEQTIQSMQTNIGEQVVATEQQRAKTVQDTLKKFEGLVVSFKLNVAVDTEKIRRLQREEERSMSYLDIQ